MNKYVIEFSSEELSEDQRESLLSYLDIMDFEQISISTKENSKDTTKSIPKLFIGDLMTGQKFRYTSSSFSLKDNNVVLIVSDDMESHRIRKCVVISSNDPKDIGRIFAFPFHYADITLVEDDR